MRRWVAQTNEMRTAELANAVSNQLINWPKTYRLPFGNRTRRRSMKLELILIQKRERHWRSCHQLKPTTPPPATTLTGCRRRDEGPDVKSLIMLTMIYNWVHPLVQLIKRAPPLHCHYSMNNHHRPQMIWQSHIPVCSTPTSLFVCDLSILLILYLFLLICSNITTIVRICWSSKPSHDLLLKQFIAGAIYDTRIPECPLQLGVRWQRSK